jgi:hypothetical protein
MIVPCGLHHSFKQFGNTQLRDQTSEAIEKSVNAKKALKWQEGSFTYPDLAGQAGAASKPAEPSAARGCTEARPRTLRAAVPGPRPPPPALPRPGAEAVSDLREPSWEGGEGAGKRSLRLHRSSGQVSGMRAASAQLCMRFSRLEAADPGSAKPAWKEALAPPRGVTPGPPLLPPPRAPRQLSGPAPHRRRVPHRPASRAPPPCREPESSPIFGSRSPRPHHSP